jgi:hypothetical protein
MALFHTFYVIKVFYLKKGIVLTVSYGMQA